MTIHVADQPLAQQIEGGFKVGERVGIIAAGDLATSVAAAKAAVDVKNAKAHVADRPLGNTVKASIDLVDGVVAAGSSTGGDLSAIYAAIPGNSTEGGVVGM